MSWRWLDLRVIVAAHDEQLAEHGGSAGIRDRGLLESAMARPQNLAGYEAPDVAAVAASYGFGIARSHPFVDGNKRAALVAIELFLALNGHALTATDVECVVTILALAAGTMDEAQLAKQLAEWIRSKLPRR